MDAEGARALKKRIEHYTVPRYPRVTLTPPQTQALVSLLTTIGVYLSIDVREGEMGDVLVTVWRQGYDTTWTLHPDGGTYETPAIP